jgi:twitching motility protein PilJ
VNNVLSGNEDAVTAADRFFTDATQFGRVLNGQLDGNNALGVTRVANEDALYGLGAISELFGFIASNADAVLRVSPDLLKASNAANDIFENSEILLTELSELAAELRDLSAARIISPTLAFAMLAAAIAIVVFIGLAVCRKSQTRLAKTQAQNDQNQSAILRLLDELADASEHQAREIAGTSAAVNEMAVSIDQVSSNAAESSAAVERSVAIAKKGTDVVQNTVRGMDNICEQVQETSKRIKRLGESSQEIGDIVSLINDIADQTNILSLNAAIQASMAGDAGRGFAVVADEVQRLAERSSAATKQIETLVKTIQSDTNKAAVSMEHTTAEVVRGACLAQDACVALEEIENVSTNLAELIQNISNAARRQSSSAAHISNTMNVIQEITSQTSSGTNATAYSIGNLADMAFELRSSVAGFKLPEEDEVGDIKVPLVS